MSKANGVPPAVGGLTARSLGRGTKREAGYQSLDFLVSLLYLPQEYAKDCYPKVRLEAGALHLANYLIRVRGLFLVAKVTLIIESARALYKKTKPDSLNFFKGYRESTLQIYDS